MSCIALSELSDQLKAACILLKVSSCNDAPIWSKNSGALAKRSSTDYDHDVFEVTFVYDETLMVVATTPRAMMLAVNKLVSLPTKILASVGFVINVINWGKNKTECFLSLRGENTVIIIDGIRKNDFKRQFT